MGRTEWINITRFPREGKSFIIAMLIWTSLNCYNDTEGHQRGDEILRKFGKSIRDRFRNRIFVDDMEEMRLL